MLTVKRKRTEVAMNVYAESVALLWSTALRGARAAPRAAWPEPAPEPVVPAAPRRRGGAWRAWLARQPRE
jgi:hypothetical protein